MAIRAVEGSTSTARGKLAVLAILVLGSLASCDQSHPPPPCLTACGGTGPDCDTQYEPPPTPGDQDGDGIENDVDEDADGDGIDNVFEHLGGFSCAGPDDDGDGVANWLDTDSDNDGLLDGTEGAERGDGETDPYDADSDDDGASDLIEVAARTVATDPDSLPNDKSTILIPAFGESVSFTVRFPNRVENADIFFLVDTTGSMGEERRALISAISNVIVPALSDAFDSVAFGAGGMDDYPVGMFGSAESQDLPFYLLTSMVDGLTDTRTTTATPAGCASPYGIMSEGANGVPDIEDAILSLGCHGGSDLPESFVPALYATATGAELTWAGGSVPARTSCALDEFGYPCFREDALPVILLIGDASFHNGPGDSEPYSFAAPTYADAVEALNDIGARVVSVYSGPDDDQGDYDQLGMDTGTLGPDGMPLVYPISPMGEGLDTTVVDGIETLAASVTQDVSCAYTDADDDSSDATALVVSYRATEGYAPDGAPGANPGTSYESISGDMLSFVAVEPSAEVEFEFTIQNDSVTPGEEARVLILKLEAQGIGDATFSTRRVFIVVAQNAEDLVGLP